jgi:REP-associated tyrosine transposase
MARLARAVVPGIPHHITQRGNRRQRTFLEEDDYRRYLALMAEWCAAYSVEIWAWCLMPNHSHLIAVPRTADGLRFAMAEAHRRYTVAINKREGWQGYLWQGRFNSFAMDERHTLAAARYIEQNPVRAGLVAHASDYPWSSARAHLAGRDDALVRVEPLLHRVPDWRRFLGELDGKAGEELRMHQTTGRPLGNDAFVDEMEIRLGRRLRALRAGRRPSAEHPTKICIVSPNSSEPRA